MTASLPDDDTFSLQCVGLDLHVAVFGKVDSQLRLQREQRRSSEHLAAHGLAEGAQYDPTVPRPCAVHQNLVVRVAGAQDDEPTVLTVPYPVVDLQQDGRVGPVLAGHGAGRVVERNVHLGESPAVLGPEAPVAEGLPAQHLSEDSADGDHRLGDGLGSHRRLVRQRAAADVLPVDGDQDAVGALFQLVTFLINLGQCNRRSSSPVRCLRIAALPRFS